MSKEYTGVLFPASETTGATLTMPHGTAPTSPVDGDIWTTTAGVFARINGVTVGPFGAGGGGPTTINAPFEFGAGSKGGAPIPVNNADAGGVAAFEYTLGNWYMEVYPTISSGTFTVDIRRAASGAYPPVSSICAGSAPTITTGNEASGNSAGFSSNVIDPVDAVDAVVTVNTAGVQWWRLVFEAVRPI